MMMSFKEKFLDRRESLENGSISSIPPFENSFRIGKIRHLVK